MPLSRTHLAWIARSRSQDAARLGVDPVHLGMVVVFNLMIGLVTPPMGLALFLVSDIANCALDAGHYFPGDSIASSTSARNFHWFHASARIASPTRTITIFSAGRMVMR